MSNLTLTDDDFQAAAATLGCSVEAVKAVAITETSGGGFNPDGTPKTLFEGHLFSGFTGHQYDETHPRISYLHWTKEFYGHNWEEEQARLESAKALDEEAALKSASWGMFQILGENFKECGYENVNDFVTAMSEGAGAQLNAFVQFVIHKHLADELQNLDWADFAKVYNGPGQVAVYADHMGKAYAKAQAEDGTA